VNSLIALAGITGEEESLRYTERLSLTMHRRLDCPMSGVLEDF
jgi:hypothetical protein